MYECGGGGETLHQVRTRYVVHQRPDFRDRGVSRALRPPLHRRRTAHAPRIRMGYLSALAIIRTCHLIGPAERSRHRKPALDGE